MRRQLSKLDHEQLLNLIRQAEVRIGELKEDEDKCDILHCSSSIEYVWADRDGEVLAERCRTHTAFKDADMYDDCYSLDEYEEKFGPRD